MDYKLINTAFIFLVLLSSQALATPIKAGIDDFAGTDTLIDFNVVSSREAITNQYDAQGVTFGALLGLTTFDSADPILYFDGSTIASNWDLSKPNREGATWTANFSNIQNFVGFYAEALPSDGVQIETFLNGGLLGSVYFSNPNGFWGLTDPLAIFDEEGFDSISVTTENNSFGFFAMDDFRFASVEEPATLALLLISLAGIRRFRRKYS